MTRKVFSASEDDYLRAHYCKLTSRQMADALGRTKSSVKNRMNKLALLRSKDAREMMIRSTQFRRGQVSHNKGQRGIRVSPATEFKAGHLPHNTKHDGCIVVRVHKPTKTAYKYIRVALGKWELLHRHNWKKAHGKIPLSHIVGFKDGDTLNCDVRNLYLMSRADNARRNANREKAAESMRDAWRRMWHFDHDNYIATMLAQRDRELRADILRQPELIELKRSQLKLRRALREVDAKRIAG